MVPNSGVWKDGFATAKLFKHGHKIGINVRKDFLIHHVRIVRVSLHRLECWDFTKERSIMRVESFMAGGKVGESKWTTARKLIEPLSNLPPETMVAANDHHNLSLYEPGGMPERYIGVVDIRGELVIPK